MGFYAETTDTELDDENELSNGVNDFGHHITTCFTVN